MQTLHRLRPGAFVAREDAEREEAREASLAMQRVAVRFYYSFDALPMIASSLRAVNLAERTGGSVSAATTYGMLAMTVGISKLHALGNLYADLAREHGRAADDRSGLVFALYAKAAWRVGDAAWSEVRALCSDALEAGEAGGGAPDPQDVAIAKTLLAHVDFYTGRFEESRRLYGEIEAAARARGNPQHTAWGLYAAARALIPLGEVDKARAMLEESHALLEEQVDVPSRLICPGLLAGVYWSLGNRDKALAFADLTSARIRQNLPTVFATVAGYEGAAKVYLAEWERAKGDRAGGGAARRTAQRAVLALGTLAWSIPIGRPYYHRIKGCERRIAGDERAARRSFERAVSWAKRLEMPYEEGLALAHLAQLEPPGSPARRTRAERAASLFVELSCPDDLARVRRLAD